jgi:GAF domain-containing protein
MESRNNMIKRLFRPPVFAGDEEKTRLAGLLNTIILIQFFVPFILLVNAVRIPNNRVVLLPILLAFTLPLVLMLFFMRRGYVRPVSITVIVFLTTVAVLFGYLNGGQTRAVVIYYPLIIVVAGLLLGGNSAIITSLVSSLLLGLVTYAGAKGLFREVVQAPALEVSIFTYAMGFMITGIILRLAANSIGVALERARSGEDQLIEGNRELQNLSASLEQRVAVRTDELAKRSLDLEIANRQIQRRAAQFEAVAQVTQTITSVRDLQKLLPSIAEVISEKFGFYHVGVFLLDDVNEYAVLSATNSEGGKKMLERRHRLRVGEQGIVGNVTLTGNPHIAMDVGADAVFFDNPELEETHSEMALPLKSGDYIIGALDVQSTEIGAFNQEDIQMLSLLANQVSLAIENARLFEETRRALSESEAISRQSTREAWRRLPTEQNLLGFRYTLAGASQLDKPLELVETAKGKNKSKPADSARVIVPIELRGETIGTLVVQAPARGHMNQDQLDLIKAVAERVAISAENARLFDETTRRAERERMVSDITGKIRSVNDPQAMIQTAIEELRNALGASHVEVIPQIVKGAE